MKHTLLASALVTVLLSCAAAQDNPQASLDPGGRAVYSKPAIAQTPPDFCKPCLFYAGDFDSNASDANGLANEVDLIVSTGAAVYTPFIVPKGKTWTVTGLFTVNFMSGTTLSPKTIPYEIRRNIPNTGGNGGQLVCHGKKLATVAYSLKECEDFGFGCYPTIVTNIEGCRLPAGKYWLSVVPYCTNTSECQGWRGFLANDDGAMANRYGRLEPAYDSFFNSKFYGANWVPASVSDPPTQSSPRFNARFSVGVEGTAN